MQLLQGSWHLLYWNVQLYILSIWADQTKSKRLNTTDHIVEDCLSHLFTQHMRELRLFHKN